MGIKPICRMCKQELTGFGGILFSPPFSGGDLVDAVEKRHLCKGCYDVIEKLVDSGMAHQQRL